MTIAGAGQTTEEAVCASKELFIRAGDGVLLWKGRSMERDGEEDGSAFGGWWTIDQQCRDLVSDPTPILPRYSAPRVVATTQVRGVKLDRPNIGGERRLETLHCIRRAPRVLLVDEQSAHDEIVMVRGA